MSTSFTERLRAAADLLESVAGNRGLLAEVSEEDRTRLLRAAGEVSRPDAISRWRLKENTRRIRKELKTQREESALSQTGIRRLRRQPVFTTPNVFPPVKFEQCDVEDADFREAVEPQHCYVCKRD